ncbi:MAG: carbohydrate binding family 9 domain-containing protein [Ignavibacteriae bacterium]|nr:carbohydrate binding family 9 domain-containing protein [Ignavibacteriota bacterium]
MHPSCALVLFLLAACPVQTLSQTEWQRKAPSLKALNLIDEPINIDGRLDELIWQKAEVGTNFIQRDPQDGSPATEQTEVRVLYNPNAIFVGIRALDSQAGEIHAELARRDKRSQSDELSVVFDSFHDTRTAFEFIVNPSGSIRDIYYFNDSRDNSDVSWDPVWEVKTSIDTAGWTAEFRIPFTQLRFEKDNTTWGLQVWRLLQREAEYSYWSPYSKEASGFVSNFGRLEGLSGLSSPVRFELRPYTVGNSRFRPSSNGSVYTPARQVEFNGGIDLKYGLTSDFTLDLALNPDFGQVEADPSVVNLSSFETFYPEKRPLFIEGSGLFSVGLPVGQMFYSRRIGRAPRGGAIPPLGGTVETPEVSTIIAATKVTGKTVNGLGIGVLSAVTAKELATLRDSTGARVGEGVVEPLTHHFAGRIEKDYDEGNHTIGGMFTAVNRRLTDETNFLRTAAYVGELDGTHRWDDKAYIFRWRIAASELRGNEGAIDRAQRSALHNFQRPDQSYLDYDPMRTSLSGYTVYLQAGKTAGTWQYVVTAARISPGFDISDLGFQGQASDVQPVTLWTQYLQSRPQWIFRNYSISLNVERYWTTNGDVTWGWIRPVLFNGTFENNWYIELNPMAFGSLPSVSTSALRGGPALREDAWHNSFGTIGTDPRKPVSVEISGSAGGTFETRAKWHDYSPSLTLRPSTVFNISVGLSYSWSRDPAQWVGNFVVSDTTRYVVAEILQKTLSLTTRLNWILSPSLSVELYASPFVSSGEYFSFKQVREPRASEFDKRYKRYQNVIDNGDGTESIDVNDDGSYDFSLGKPDFSFRQLRSTLVIRWEYRQGSVIYLAWQHGRERFLKDGSFHSFSDIEDIFHHDSDNTLLLKLNYWLSF